jgi:hypothetical protein
MNRTRRAFDYQPPSFEEASKLTERRGSRFDNIIKQDGPRFFKARGGDNFIRILPPTWDNAKHYALAIKIHRSIGPDNATYLCLKENETSPEKDCPICEERYRSGIPQKDNDTLRAQTSQLIYLIDRANEDQGPMIWTISNKSDLEILAQSLEKRQSRYLPIAHPIDGYDVEFVRDGEGINTRYRGFKVARTSSPVHDNADRLEEWLNYIEDNPITDLLNYYSAEHIKSVFHGKSAPAPEEERSRVREEPAPRAREAQPEAPREAPQSNGRVDPPFDVDPPRRASLGGNGEERERPSPREVEPQPERRRATIAPEPQEDTKRSIDSLRARLSSRGGNA